MTDLEMTKLCAEAMSFQYNEWSHLTPSKTGSGIAAWIGDDDPRINYDPLHDDAQTMVLVKKFALSLAWYDSENMNVWSASSNFRPNTERFLNPNLNRAIVECVANMQKAKR